MAALITAVDLAGLIGTDNEPFILDVREADEVAAWSIPRAVNVPLGQLPARLAELPSRLVVAVCAAGARSARAALFLSAQGFRVANLEGGMQAWGQVYDRAAWEVPGATIVQLRRRAKGCLSYIVGAGSEAFVFDPSTRSEEYLAVAREHGWRISRVFETHLHADHLCGGRALASLIGASLHLNPDDAFGYPFEPTSDGEQLALPAERGSRFSTTVVHCPGHTPGSTVYRVGEAALISGDTLFVDGVGRPDLADQAEEFARKLYQSLITKVLVLPDGTDVLPAHHGAGTVVVPGRPVQARLGDLRHTVGALSLGEQEFVAWAVSRPSERPPNYRDIAIANSAGTVDLELQALEAGPNRCAC